MDAGYIDEFGYVYVTARDDDIINVAGHRISTAALEDIILSHTDVADAAVVGVPDPTKGEVPLCLYVKKGSQYCQIFICFFLLLISFLMLFYFNAILSKYFRNKKSMI